MAVAYEADGGTVFPAANNNTAISVPLPGTRPIGSVLLCVIWSRLITDVVGTAPSGYTLLSGFPKTSGTASGGRIWVYARIVTGSESAPTVACTSAVTGTSGDLWGAAIFCYSGVDTSGGLDAMLDGTPTVQDASGTTTCTYPALTTTGADSMALRFLARFRDAVDTFTPTATWNEREDIGSTTRLGGQFHLQDKIVTPGAQATVTVAPSNTTAARYLAITLALKKAAPLVTGTAAITGAGALAATGLARRPLAFPSTPVLDTFSRADETPPAGWSPVHQLRLVDNQLAPTLDGFSYGFWGIPMSSPNVEAYATVNALPSDTTTVYARHNAVQTGYNVRWGAAQQMTLNVETVGVETQLGIWAQVLSAGDAIGIRCIGSQIEAWVRKSGSWRLVGVATDTSNPGTGSNSRIAVSVSGLTSTRLDNFGGGEVVLPSFPTTPIFEHFNRADENPLVHPASGGIWNSNFKIASNQIEPTAATDNYAQWYGSNFESPDQEAYVTITTVGATGTVTGVAVRDDFAGANYTASHTVQAGTDIFRLRRGGAFGTQIGGDWFLNLADGSEFGIRAVGSRIEVWARVFDNDPWTLVGAVTDTTHPGDTTISRPSLYHFSGGSLVAPARFDAFGGGEVELQPIPFPTTLVLDNFNRANQGPPPSSNWADRYAAGLVVDGNQLAPTLAEWNGAFWTATAFGKDVEAYLEIGTLPTVLGSQILLQLRDDFAGSSYNLILYLQGDGTWMTRVDRSIAWTGTNLIPPSFPAIETVDAIGLRCVGPRIEHWIQISGTWKLLGSAIDTAIPGAGTEKIFVPFHSPAVIPTGVRFDNFGGGTFTGKAVVQGSAALSGSGALVATGAVVISVHVTIPTPPIGAIAGQVLVGVALAGQMSSGDIWTDEPVLADGGTGQGIISKNGSATLTGRGSIVETFGKRIPQGLATIEGWGDLIATATSTRKAQATLTGQGTLFGNAQEYDVLFGAATLTGAGALTGQGIRKFFGTVVLTGTGTLSGVPPVQIDVTIPVLPLVELLVSPSRLVGQYVVGQIFSGDRYINTALDLALDSATFKADQNHLLPDSEALLLPTELNSLFRDQVITVDSAVAMSLMAGTASYVLRLLSPSPPVSLDLVPTEEEYLVLTPASEVAVTLVPTNVEEG